MIQEIIFPQTRMFGCNGKFHFPEIHFLLTNIYSFDPEIILHSYFQFKSFLEREREREERAQIGERERKKRLRRRSTSGAIVRRARSSIAPLVDRDCERTRRSTSSAIVRRARSSIAPLVDRAPRRSRRSSDDRTDLAFNLAFTARSHLLLRCAISI